MSADWVSTIRDSPEVKRFPIPGKSDYLQLTDREIEVLGYIAIGFNNTQTGRKLFITAETVKAHRRTIYMKLDARNGPHAVAIALVNELI